MEESPKKSRKEFDSEHTYWSTEVSMAEKSLEPFLKVARKLTDIYVARKQWEAEDFLGKESQYHIYWSINQILKPSTYARTPKPVVERRFRDQDPVGRLSSTILERALRTQIENDAFNPAMQASRDDWLIRARGASWVYYDPTIGQDDAGQESIVYEETFPRNLHWRDMLYPVARDWLELQKRWIGKKVYLTREELVDKFGSDIGNKVELDYSPSHTDDRKNDDKDAVKQACIIEIWDASKREVVWFNKGYEGILGKEADPLKLRGFYPCPRPLFATLDSDTLVPVADYVQYADLAHTLNIIEWKIESLTTALRVVGVRDASMDELTRIFDEGCENELIPVKNWPVWIDKGGFKGVMQFMPLAEIVSTLQVLYESFDQIENRIYKVVGVSDIIRGASDPRETLGAQQLKSQFFSVRIQEYQRDMQRFVRDNIRIMAEIISEKFSEQTLWLISDMEQMKQEEQAQFPAAIQLLRQDALRNFRIDIETDSTVFEEVQQEKAERLEFVDALFRGIGTVAPLVQQTPELLPLVGEVLTFSARSFKAGRTLENAIEEAVKAIQTKEPAQTPPDPKMLELQQKNQMEMARMQAETQKAEQELLIKREELMSKERIELGKMEVERVKLMQEDMRIKIEAATKEQELQQRVFEIQTNAATAATQMESSAKATQQGQQAPIVLNIGGGSKRAVRLATDPLTGEKVGVVEDIPEVVPAGVV